MTELTVALAQISATDDVQENLRIVANHTERARSQGAQLVVFPEATMRHFGGSLVDVAQPLTGQWANAVRNIARENNITIIVGMFTPGEGNRVRNTLLVTGPNVDVHYDKIHLYDAFGFVESDGITPGDKPVTVVVDGVTVGVTTCYDIRFPELYQQLADSGAQLITVSASWGAGPGKVAQWQTLSRARALDSTCFVAAVGQADPASAGYDVVGSAPRGVGHSAMTSPLGEVLCELGDEAGLLVVTVDSDDVSTAREQLPVLANRKIALTALK